MRGEEKRINIEAGPLVWLRGALPVGWGGGRLKTFRLLALQGNQFKVIRGETVAITELERLSRITQSESDKPGEQEREIIITLFSNNSK